MDMSSIVENNDDDSFIILGTSPGTSLDIKCNGAENGEDQLDKVQLEEAMKDLSCEANLAFKAHFKLDTCPSPNSMMIASTIITDDKSTEELQKQFGELLDENVLLKETLKQNNDSIKEQFLLIASCQEDMMRTHKMHKEKFVETKELVERLRQENKKLKQEIVAARTNGEGDSVAVNNETGEEGKSGPASALEFVTSPDDDTIDKLTAQLELVEKQRRQVIVENEKLTWQKESLEHIVDATSKERDDLKEKLKNVELQLSTKDSHYAVEINNLKYTIQDLNNKLQAVSNASTSSSGELNKRDTYIAQLDSRVSTLQNELKSAQLKIFELESVKMEFIQYKSGISDTLKVYKDQIQDLNNRLKEASTTMFQPVRISINNEAHNSSSSDNLAFNTNVKLYDRTLKHLAELFNVLTRGLSDSLVQTMGVVASLQDFKLELCTVERFQSSLADVRQQLEKQHSATLNNIGQVKGTLTIFEGIFKDYNEVLKKTNNLDTVPVNTHNVEALTAALVARGQELQALETELVKWKSFKEDTDLLKAQIDLYKSDFEAEREAREKMASEKEHILTDLRTTQRRNEELLRQLDQTRGTGVIRVNKTKLNKGPSVGQTTSFTPIPTAGNMVRKKKKLSEDSTEGANGNASPPPLRYDCPVCDKPFKTLILLQQHVDNCLL